MGRGRDASMSPPSPHVYFVCEITLLQLLKIKYISIGWGALKNNALTYRRRLYICPLLCLSWPLYPPSPKFGVLRIRFLGHASTPTNCQPPYMYMYMYKYAKKKKKTTQPRIAARPSITRESNERNFFRRCCLGCCSNTPVRKTSNETDVRAE